MRRKTPLSKEEFLQDLQQYTHRKLSIRFNKNRTTYLSGTQNRNRLWMSVHQEFLFARSPIRQAIVAYFENHRSQTGVLLKKYYYEVISKKIEQKLTVYHTLGKVYDLKRIYDQLNNKYFNNRIKLSISWFTKPRYKRFCTITYGSYDQTLKLIKINELLDNKKVPKYFVEFVVYHEMLHHICPPFFDKNGRRIVHTPFFKQKEREFSFFEWAKVWEKEYGRP